MRRSPVCTHFLVHGLSAFAASSSANGLIGDGLGEPIVEPGDLLVGGDMNGVLAFRAGTAEFLGQVAPIGFNQPLNLEIGPDGTLWTSERGIMWRIDPGSTMPDLAFGHVIQNGHLVQFDVAVNGIVYAVESQPSHIVRFDPISGVVTVFESGYSPSEVAVGPDNRLYIYSRSTGAILRFNPHTGQFIDEFISESDLETSVVALEFTDTGDLLVLQGDNGASNFVQRYDGATGSPLNIVAISDSNGHGSIRNISLSPAGNVFVCTDEGVFVYSIDGSFRRQFARAGPEIDGFRDIVFRPGTNPIALVTKILSINDSAREVVELDRTTGDILRLVFDRRVEDALAIPGKLVCGPDGFLYAPSRQFEAVLRYDMSTGTLLDHFVAYRDGDLRGPWGIAFGPDGHLYVGDAGPDSAIRRYSGDTGEYLGIVCQ